MFIAISWAFMMINIDSNDGILGFSGGKSVQKPTSHCANDLFHHRLVVVHQLEEGQEWSPDLCFATNFWDISTRISIQILGIKWQMCSVYLRTGSTKPPPLAQDLFIALISNGMFNFHSWLMVESHSVVFFNDSIEMSIQTYQSVSWKLIITCLDYFAAKITQVPQVKDNEVPGNTSKLRQITSGGQPDFWFLHDLYMIFPSKTHSILFGMAGIQSIKMIGGLFIYFWIYHIILLTITNHDWIMDNQPQQWLAKLEWKC